MKLKERLILRCIAFLIKRLDERTLDDFRNYLLQALGFNVVVFDEAELNKLITEEGGKHEKQYH